MKKIMPFLLLVNNVALVFLSPLVLLIIVILIFGAPNTANDNNFILVIFVSWTVLFTIFAIINRRTISDWIKGTGYIIAFGSQFNHYNQASDSPDPVYRSGILQLSRLKFEQNRQKRYAIINLTMSIILVFITISEIGTISNTINDELNPETVNLVDDCNKIYPINTNENMNMLIEMLASDENRTASSEPLQSRVESYLRSDIQVKKRMSCIASALPIQNNIRKIIPVRENNKQNAALLENISMPDLYSMIGRFFLVLLMQTLTFFFLRMYVGNLADARYLSNEMTNFEHKLFSYLIATSNNDKDTLAEISKFSLRTERNPLTTNGKRPFFAAAPPVIKELTEQVADLKSLLTDFSARK